jgi:uncharacterized protein (DUF433 family)
MKADFPLIAFTTDTVSRLTGLSTRQLHSWDRKRFFIPAFADPQRRRPYSRVYSFKDIVSLRTIAELLRRGVSFSDLWKVRGFFEADDNESWSNRSFYVVGNRVFFQHQEAIIATRPLGQVAEATILEIGPIARATAEDVKKLTERGEDEYGQVTKDRLIMRGAPIIAGTRIPTATIAWFVDHGYNTDEILREFPRLTWKDIQAAVGYERDKVIGVSEADAAIA